LKSKYKIAVCSRQTVMQKDSIEALYQNRNPLVQEAGSRASPMLLLLLLKRKWNRQRKLESWQQRSIEYSAS